MMNARDYLIFPLDLPDRKKAEQYVRTLCQKVGIFKVGLELFVSEGHDILNMISDYSDARIFLDLKLHDIPATVQKAMEVISRFGVEFVTVHCSEGLPLLSAAVLSGSDTKALGVTVLTSLDKADLIAAGLSAEYANNIEKLVLKRAELAYRAGCIGVVCSPLEAKAVKTKIPGLLVVTPGIRPAWSIVGADDQKRVSTPCQAILNGADYLVVGRPIRLAKDPKDAADKTVEEIRNGLEQKALN
ncbi:MAG: orotidine-5'-phosphate decarboxylase [Pseudomonadota bacterium]